MLLNINDLSGLGIIDDYRLGNKQPLIDALKGGEELGYNVREFLTDIVEGKIKIDRRTLAKERDKDRNNQIVAHILICKGLGYPERNDRAYEEKPSAIDVVGSIFDLDRDHIYKIWQKSDIKLANKKIELIGKAILINNNNVIPADFKASLDEYRKLSKKSQKKHFENARTVMRNEYLEKLAKDENISFKEIKEIYKNNKRHFCIPYYLSEIDE